MSKIFRKTTYIGTVINNDCNHPFQHKEVAFYNYINRLTRIPLNFNKELNIIWQIAENNGYSKDLIYKLLNKKLIYRANMS